MTNAERVQSIEKAAKLLTSAASAYRHGRVSTGVAKVDEAVFVLQFVTFPRP